jgi:hypothetical protein
VFEDFGEEFFVDFIELLKSAFESVLVFVGGFVKKLGELVGGVVHQHLGVFDPLAVGGEIDMDELGVVIDLFEGGVGLVGVTVEHLLAGDLGHGVDELGVEEALVTGAGLLGTKLELRERLGVGKVVAVAEGERRRAESEKQRQRKKNCSGTKD